MDTVISTVFLDGSNKAIKLAALYNDKIVLPSTGNALIGFEEPEELKIGYRGPGTVVANWSTVPDRARKQLLPLVDEGIAVFSGAYHANSNPVEEGGLYDTFDDVRKTLFTIGKRSNELLNNFPELGQVASGRSPAVNFTRSRLEHYYTLYDLLKAYYGFLAEVALSESIYYDIPLATDSEVVGILLSHFLKGDQVRKKFNVAEAKTGFLTQRVLEEFLPDIKDASIEDVLEVRYKLNNELEAFRVAMSQFSKKIKNNPWHPDIEHEANNIIETSVKPKLYELKTALRQSNWRALTRVFADLRNPTAYVPFVGTVLAHMEPTTGILASLGISAFRSLYETMLERQKIRDASGLMFLLKAPSRFPMKMGILAPEEPALGNIASPAHPRSHRRNPRLTLIGRQS
jgi:hypothetical protein